jgi:hypothetical protein
MATRLVLLTASALLIPLAGSCSPSVTEDRQGPAGTQPDGFQDAQHVTVYRNADTVPNVATFCLGRFGWASTLKASGSSDSGSSGGAAPSLVRFPELDKVCVT